MWMKIKKALTANIGFKILALVFSIALWMIVVNVDDPEQTKTFTATVQVINENVLTDQGKYYTLTDGNTVSFRVTAQRSVLERLSSSDFTATADMNYLEDDERIPVDITVNRYASSVRISAQRLYLKVEVGDEMDARFSIRGETTGDPADGFAVDEVSVVPNVISVRGPAEYVSKIESVRAYCDVTGRNMDTSETVVPVFMTRSGKKVVHAASGQRGYRGRLRGDCKRQGGADCGGNQRKSGGRPGIDRHYHGSGNCHDQGGEQ